MEKDTVALLLGVTFGFAVVGLIIGVSLLMARAQPTVVLGSNNGYSTYKNSETWSVVKDKDGRVREIKVDRLATEA